MSVILITELPALFINGEIMNLSDLIPSIIGQVYKFTFGVDSTLNLAYHVQELNPQSDGLTLTLPQPADPTAIRLINNTNYTIFINSPYDKFSLSAYSTISLFYTGTMGKWLQTLMDNTESFTDIDPNNLHCGNTNQVFSSSTGIGNVATLDDDNIVVYSGGHLYRGYIQQDTITFYDCGTVPSNNFDVLDSTHLIFLSTYNTGSGSTTTTHHSLRAASLINDSITIGAELVILNHNQYSSYYYDLAALTSNSAVVAYSEHYSGGTQDHTLNIKIIQMASNLSLTVSLSAIISNSNDISYQDTYLARLTDTKFILSHNGGWQVCTIGGSLTLGAVNYPGSPYYGPSAVGGIVAVDEETVYMIGYHHPGGSSGHYLFVYKGIISGTTISDSRQLIYSASNYDTDAGRIYKLSDNKIFVIYKELALHEQRLVLITDLLSVGTSCLIDYNLTIGGLAAPNPYAGMLAIGGSISGQNCSAMRIIN